MAVFESPLITQALCGFALDVIVNHFCTGNYVNCLMGI